MVDQGQEMLDGNSKEGWLNSKWRPMMGWMYMAVCTMDFIVFPILWSLLQAMNDGKVETQWSPITLQGAGLFHMAMGAVIGVAAFGRTQEKLAGVSSPSYPSIPSGFTTPNNITQTQPIPSPTTINYNNGFSIPTPIATTASGKKIVPIMDEPEL